MNIVKFGQSNNKKVVFCLVDRLSLCQDDFTKEIIKNQTDYVITKLCTKYNILQGFDEDCLLDCAADEEYDYAVVFSTGTEFINGNSFFENLKKLFEQDFFICGHVLDRKDAYYEVHHQCYVVNLKVFKNLGMPFVGQQKLGASHRQAVPIRSEDNLHDDYTPRWIKPGFQINTFNHQCHGWNILSVALENNQSVLVFNEDFRKSKIHYYPENRKDFIKQLSWIYYRDQECSTNFVHTKHTEGSYPIEGTFEQIVIPASGTNYLDRIDSGSVIIYDYNEKSLEYWKEHLPRKEEILYTFIKTDLLVDTKLIETILENKKTLVNLSNIFAYEGTSAFKPLYYRLQKENEIILSIQKKIPDAIILFSMRAAEGFTDTPKTGDKSIIKPIKLSTLTKPTWHYNSDWL